MKNDLDRAHEALLVLPPEEFQRHLVELLGRKARSLPPAEGLRLLFGVEAGIYPTEGELSIAYDGGVHTKHRHIRYHDFFVQRVRPGERVLDVGCGSGELAFDLADKGGAQVLGVDINPASIDKACQRHAHERVQYLLADVVTELPEHAYDVLVLSNVLEHLSGRPEFLRRVVRKYSPRRLLLRVPLFEREWRVPLKQELGVEWRLDPTHETEYTLESYVKEMASAGLVESHREIRWGEIWAELVPSEDFGEQASIAPE